MKKLIVIAVIIPILLLSFWGIKKMFPGYEDDSAVEEIIEDIVEHHSDIDIDLTPESMENENKT